MFPYVCSAPTRFNWVSKSSAQCRPTDTAVRRLFSLGCAHCLGQLLSCPVSTCARIWCPTDKDVSAASIYCLLSVTRRIMSVAVCVYLHVCLCVIELHTLLSNIFIIICCCGCCCSTCSSIESPCVYCAALIAMLNKATAFGGGGGGGLPLFVLGVIDCLRW